MKTPLELAFKHMTPAPHVEARVRERAERLERFFGRVDSCVVSVEAPHQHHRKGNRYAVRIHLRVPGGDLSIDRRPGDDDAHEDVLVAVRDAFDAAERKLSKWKERHSGRPAESVAPLQGRIAERRADDRWGWIETADGRRVYFHANSVVGAGFDALAAGDPVELVIDEEDAEEGPHASTVRPISRASFIDRPG